jgi:amidase
LSKEDEMINNSYNPEFFHGAPVCVQVITRRLNEEKSIAMAYVVRNCLKKKIV